MRSSLAITSVRERLNDCMHRIRESFSKGTLLALDLNLLAEKFDPDTLLATIDEVKARGWKSVSSGTHTLTLLACAPSPSLGCSVVSVHEQLERLGIVCVAGRPSRGRLPLTGGSASACQLRLEPSPAVIKRVGSSIMGDFDARDRHSLEAHWTRQINATQPTLFPRILSIRGGRDVIVQSEFFPAYTLGELLLQGRFDGPAAMSVLQKILDAIASQLSCNPAPNAGEPYLAKVKRRLEILMETNIPPLIRRLCRHGATIDGVSCPPVFELIERLEQNPRLKRLVTCSEPRQCHGDLIPEDILFSPGLDQFRLVDPNPQVRDPVADIAKLVMSLTLRYELALRDQVAVRCTEHLGTAHVETIVVGSHDQYTQACDWLRSSILSDAQVLFGSIAEEHRLQAHAILLMAGLQAMAIASFHTMHHRKHERAAYFLARGVLTASTASDQSLSLE